MYTRLTCCSIIIIIITFTIVHIDGHNFLDTGWLDFLINFALRKLLLYTVIYWTLFSDFLLLDTFERSAPKTNNARVVGGSQAEIDDFPYMVSFKKSKIYNILQKIKVIKKILNNSQGIVEVSRSSQMRWCNNS